MAKIQNADSVKWQYFWATRMFIHCWWECKMLQQLWRVEWQFLSIQSSIRAPWHLPKERKTYAHIKTCTWVFIAVLLITAKIWNLATHHVSFNFIGEWKNKVWYIETTEYYSAKNKTKLSSNEKLRIEKL